MSNWQTRRDDRAQAEQEARRGRDRGQAVAAGTRRGVALREGIDRLHGPLPILRRIHDGVCTAVDTGAQRATFAVGDVLPDGVLRGVRYWPRAPRLGEALPVFVGEQGWVWCEPPSRTRWLYRKVAGETTLLRWAWPPSVPPALWEPEVVQTALPPAWQLFGGTTSPGEATEIALDEQGAGAPFQDEGTPFVLGIGLRYHHLAAMGFGAVSREYDLDSPYLRRIDAIANDGTTTITAANVQTLVTYDGGTEAQPTLVEDGHWVCCLPNPADGEVFCVEAFSHHYEMPMVHAPDLTGYTNSASREWAGSLGALSPIETRDRPYFLYAYVAVTSNVWITVACSGSGACVWPPGDIFLHFTDIVCTEVDTPQPNGITQEQIYHDGEQNWPAFVHGAWEYDGVRRTAWVDQVETRVFHPEVLDVHIPFTETTDWRYEVRVAGGVIGAQAFPTYTNYLAGTGFLNPRVLALDPDTLELHAWWTRETPDGGSAVYRTIGTGALVLIPDITDVAHVSRDGVDIIAYTGDRSAQVFSTDSGATWQPLPGPMVPEHELGVEFVDEVA